MRIRLVGRLVAIAAGLTAGTAAAQDGLTLTPVGDRLVITGDDPAKVALAYDLARMLVKGQGNEPYKVFRLRNANAADAARVIGEWFNGVAPVGDSDPARSAAAAAKPRVRIVAEQTSNSLLVRASAMDLMSIQRILETVIDAGPGDSKAVMKPFFIGPLQNAAAAEVVAILKEVYREQTGPSAADRFGELVARPSADATGRPKTVTLTLTADERTNTVVGMATELLATEIQNVVGILEERSLNAKKVVQLVPTEGVDPSLVQEVLAMIQAPPTGMTDHGPAVDWSAASSGVFPFSAGGPLALPSLGGFAMPPGGGRGAGPGAAPGSIGRPGGRGSAGGGRGPGG
jgi:hypothetical protein